MMLAPGIAPPVRAVSAAERALPAGTRLDEYEIEGMLSQSNVAVVYRAYDRVLKMHVTIKEYLPDAIALRDVDTDVVLRDYAHAQSFERGRQAFVNEARMLAQCEHPSLQRIQRILQQHGTVYRVMRCCLGPTLEYRRRTMTETPSAASIRALLGNLLGALAELHHHGWIHAAISPGNVLMLTGDRPILLDSGAVHAALISDRTRSMMAELEPCFAPFEQRQPSADNPLGPWTDLYSLAATLQFFISGSLPLTRTGELPSTPEPFGALWKRLHGGQLGAPQEWSWLNALDECLAESAPDRPQSVAQLRARLEGVRTSSQLLAFAAPCRWTPVCIESVEAAVPSQLGVFAAPAKDIAALEQSLPFIAARAHEIVAASCTPAKAVDPSLGAQPRRRRQRWAGGVALLLLLLMVVVAVDEWMHNQSVSLAARGLGLAGAMANALTEPVAAPSAKTPAAVPTTGAGMPETGAGPAIFADSASVPSASTVLANPVDPGVASTARTPDSPRQRCGTRSGYALYQCMHVQCAKRSWTNHAQCQRLRRDQSLG